VSCSFSPSNVTWTSTCNCAVNGTWNGTCSDGKTASLDITGCGTATLTIDAITQDVAFDRCYAIP
ncbi:MAG: hypothetical protein NDJ90_06760, partial [Oligoflexia bacterium]|nr:hypothetical protein [Oligoflexia bacterium]